MVSTLRTRCLFILGRPLFLAFLLMGTFTIISLMTLHEVHVFSEVDFSVSSISIVGELPGKTIILQIHINISNYQNLFGLTILDFRYQLLVGHSGTILGEGKLMNPVLVPEPSSLMILSAFRVFNVSRFINFLVHEADTSLIQIIGELSYQLLGITSSVDFSLTYQTSSRNDISLIEELRLVQFHPIPPGTSFSLSVGLVNNLPLNMTLYDASFLVRDNVNNGSILGTAQLDEGGPLSLGLNIFNGTLQSQNEAIGNFVQSFVTGGTINATIDQLKLKIHVLEENVTLITSYDVYMGTSESIPQSFESITFNFSARAFDLVYRFESSIFWGFNLSSVSFNIYHYFSGEENATLIGSGKSTGNVFIPYNETVLVPMQVVVPFEWWDNLISEYLQNGNLFVDIKEGKTVITAYSDLNVTAHFEQLNVRVI